MQQDVKHRELQKTKTEGIISELLKGKDRDALEIASLRSTLNEREQINSSLIEEKKQLQARILALNDLLVQRQQTSPKALPHSNVLMGTLSLDVRLPQGGHRRSASK